MSAIDDALSPLATILAGHAGADAPRQAAIWAFDERLAQVARTTSEPMIGQMRLAWWGEVIADMAAKRGQGEPVVDRMREVGAMDAPGLPAIIDGWEAVVLDSEMDSKSLLDYAAGRGEGLFRALAGTGDIPPFLEQAGRAWALWDLAGHVGDAALADAAIAMGRDMVPTGVQKWPRTWKPMRIALALARHDLLAGRGAPRGLSRAMVLRILRIALVGR